MMPPAIAWTSWDLSASAHQLIANRWIAQPGGERNQATLRSQLLDEFLAPTMPSPRRILERLAPLSTPEVSNQTFGQYCFLDHFEAETADLLTCVRGNVENVGSDCVVCEQGHQNISRRPSSKNPPGQALTSSPRSFKGISRTRLCAPSGSTNNTMTSCGRTSGTPSGSFPALVSRIRRMIRRSRCSLWVSTRKVFRPSPRADSMKTSPSSAWSAGCRWISGCSIARKLVR